MPRRPLRQAAGPHPGDRRPGPPRAAGARCSQPTASSRSRSPRSTARHRPGQAAEDPHPPRAGHHPDLHRGAGAQERRAGRRDRRRLAPAPLPPRAGPPGLGRGAGRGRGQAAGRAGPAGDRRRRDGGDRRGPGDQGACSDFARPMFALYVGGMGARGKNFYNDVAPAYGYEQEAEEIQDLYLSGKKKEAEALVPTELAGGRQPGRPRVVRQGADRRVRRGRGDQPVRGARQRRTRPPPSPSSRNGSPDARPSPVRAPSTRPSGPASAPSSTARWCPYHAQWEADGMVDRERLAQGRRARACSASQLPEEYGGGGHRRLPLQRGHRRGDDPAGRSSGCGFSVHNDIIVALLRPPLGDRGAEAALAARPVLRRAHRGHRDDRAGRRLRPPGHPHHRRRRRRPLRAQRLRRPSSPTASWPTW